MGAKPRAHGNLAGARAAARYRARGGDTLWFGRGMPREWLENGKRVRVARAPTIFGLADFTIVSESGTRCIRATISPPARTPPRAMRLRLRHPEKKLPVRVFVNDAKIDAARVAGEDIDLRPSDAAAEGAIEVRAEY